MPSTPIPFAAEPHVAYVPTAGAFLQHPTDVIVVTLFKVFVAFVLFATVRMRPVTLLEQHVWPIPSKGLIVLFLVVAAAITVYRYLIEHGKLPPFMEQRAVAWLIGWQVSHMLFYFVAGFLFPRLWFLLFLVGVVWEFVEMLLGHLYRDEWWTHSYMDIPLNVTGLFLGVLLRSALLPAAHTSRFGRLMTSTPPVPLSRKTSFAVFIVAAVSIPLLKLGRLER